jgi:hypothetical protein
MGNTHIACVVSRESLIGELRARQASMVLVALFSHPCHWVGPRKSGSSGRKRQNCLREQC